MVLLWLVMACGPLFADDGRQTTAALMPVRPEPSTESTGGATADLPTPAELEEWQAAIGSVAIEVGDIFDESDPRENKLFYRLANDLHLSTREATVREWLLLQPGEHYSAQKAEETARILRKRKYLAEAEVVPSSYDPATNTVDLRVRVRDVWTLEPGVGFGRSGGTNKSRLRIAEENLFGLGQKVALAFKSDEDRSGVSLQFIDPNLFHSFWGLATDYSDNSDGSSTYLNLERPFYSLDARWSLGFSGSVTEEVTPLYESGEKASAFNSEYESYGVQGGVSKGLVNGWTRRWLAGYRYDRARFTPTTGNDLPTLELPEDRLLSYPWVGIELIEDHFATTRNRDQIGRTEDLFLGKRLRASVGWASPAFGSDRSAGIFSLGGSTGRLVGAVGEMQLAANWEGRVESGSLADALAEASSRYYHRFNEKNVFMATVAGAHADDLSLDRQLQLGGDNGLRGYPLRYQTGDTRLQGTIEERYYTDWFPFRLLRVGGAVFADVGRMWGGDPDTRDSQDWLADAGFGLRFGNARSSSIGSVLHLDLAFPLTGASDIDSMQVLLEAHTTF
jgi:outer membrane protein assembly factor BamA